MTNAFERVAEQLYSEFCKVYGNIISKDVCVEFLQINELSVINSRTVFHLLEYAMCFDRIES